MGSNRFFSKSTKKIQDKLTEVLELPEDVLFDHPRITMIGSSELYLENHKGIIEYTPESIKVSIQGCGFIHLTGKGLKLKNIKTDEIAVVGEIFALKFN